MITYRQGERKKGGCYEMLKLNNGKTLREIRKESKIPVKTLAERLGVGESRIYAIEKADETSYIMVMKYISACESWLVEKSGLEV